MGNFIFWEVVPFPDGPLSEISDGYEWGGGVTPCVRRIFLTLAIHHWPGL